MFALIGLVRGENFMNPLLQDAIMIPVHAIEGLATRFKLARNLYALMAPYYNAGRRSYYFGEDVLLDGLERRHRVLDMGCGTGYVSRLAAGKAAEVFGVDLDQVMLRKASSIAAKRAAGWPQYVRADVASLPFENESFDFCVSLGALHCVPYPKACGEAYRVLKPGGTFSVIVDYRVIPFFKPDSSATALRSAFRECGFSGIAESRIGRLYLCLRGRKR